MAIWTKLFNRDAKRTNTQQAIQENGRHRVNPLCSNYENMFAQVRPLVDEMKIVRPYGVGRNGAALPSSRTPELAVLDAPNDQMGWADFMDAALVTWLTESELNIHVHMTQGGKIYGYSILPVGSKHYYGAGNYYFDVEVDGVVEQIGEDRVMTLRYSRSPHDLTRGVSPASASFIWAQIDDCVAQYQRAYFENGAVPATITFITASTQEKYNAKRRAMETGFKGASNKNKTLYVWRQMLDTGETADEVEIEKIQGDNSTLAIKEIEEIVSDKLNKVLGVSNFILGDDSSAKYDNAELSDHQFTKRRVFPALTMFWSQFEHELNRITGGIGYGIDFNLEIPELTDRLKTKSEINKTVVETMSVAIQNGATPSAVVTALQLDERWRPLADGIYYKTLQEGLPDETVQVEMEAVKPASSTFDAVGFVKQHLLDAYEPDWKEGEENIRKYYNLLVYVAENIIKDDKSIDFDQIKKQLVEILREDAKDGMLNGAKAIMTQAIGDDRVAAITKMIEDGSFKVPEDVMNALDARTMSILENYDKATREAVSSILKEAETTAMTKAELAEKLAEAVPTRRAELIARNESHSAIQAGNYANQIQLTNELDLVTELEWSTHFDGRTCELCKAMDGKRVRLGEAFDGHIITEDGKQISFEHNEYNMNGQCPNAHCNCRCAWLTHSRPREATE